MNTRPDAEQFALFDNMPPPAEPYPMRAGSREKGGASEDAARMIDALIAGRQAELLAKFIEAGDRGLTSDEAIEAVGGDPRAYQPRVSELVKLGKIIKTPARRPTKRGATATVLNIAPEISTDPTAAQPQGEAIERAPAYPPNLG
jgi:hypothetical protein